MVPFDLLALVEKDETLEICQCFNAEVCYGEGLQHYARVNTGDIGKANGRHRKRWFSRKYFASVKNIQEFYEYLPQPEVLQYHPTLSILTLCAVPHSLIFR